MRRALLSLLGLTSVLSVHTATAGPHAGGTLLVHATGLDYSVGEEYCTTDVPPGCTSVQTRVAGTDPVVWVVYGVFLDAESPRLRGVEFGVQYSPSVTIVDHGHCADLEVPSPGWPASGTGTIVVWGDTQRGQLIPIYWFAGYVQSLGPGPSFEVAPHPQYGGHFGDDSIVPVRDEIAGYGRIGFGVDGVAPCPEVRTFTIHADGSGDRPTIADAIRIAAAGSVIELADGVYRGPGNRDIKLNHTPLTLRSVSDDPESCVIDCEGSPQESHRGIRIDWMENTNSLVRGIKIINGYIGPEQSPDIEGGAIKIDIEGSLRIANCVFENCVAAGTGGAVDAGGVSIAIVDGVFRDNHSLGYGGGGFAGGGDIRVARCLFVDNTAPVAGGGFWATRAHLEMEDCVFLRNEADFGGGAHVYGTSGSILRSSWSGNRARQSGGGLYAAEGHLEIGRATFVDNEGRRGGAIALLATAPTDLLLRESIVAFNKGNQAIDCGKGSVDAWRSDVWGNTGGDWTDCLTGQLGLRGNISANPLFCDRVGGDLRVEESSPCATGLGLEDGPMGAFPVGCGAPRAEDTAMGALLRERAAGAAARTEASGEGGNETVPDDGTLREPYLKIAPNPFREGIEIELALPGAIQEPIELAIFDSAGRRVRSLDPASTGSGVIRSTWDGRDAVGRDVPWGTYFCRARAGDRVVSERIVKIRSARSR